MADNTTLDTGTGGDTIRTEDRTTYKTPVSLIDVGGTAAEALIGDSGVAMPVKGLGTAGAAHTGVVTVQGIASGTEIAVSIASVPSHAVTNVGTFATQITGDALTSLQLIDNAVSGAGFNITQFAGAAVPIGAGLEATALRVTIATDSTGVVSIDDNGGSITVDGTVAVSGTVTVGSHEVTNAGTFAVQAAQSGTWNVGTVTTLTTCGTVTTLTGSGVAHDGADSGNPHKIGARAVTSVSAQTLVAANDRTDLLSGLDGVQLTRPHCNLEDIATGNATNTDGTSTQCIAAQAAGIKTYLTSIVLCNSSATDITVDIKDGSTTKISIPVPAGGGAIFNPPVPLPGTAATAWNFDPSAAATTVTCSMIGFKSKV